MYLNVQGGLKAGEAQTKHISLSIPTAGVRILDTMMIQFQLITCQNRMCFLNGITGRILVFGLSQQISRIDTRAYHLQPSASKRVYSVVLPRHSLALLLSLTLMVESLMLGSGGRSPVNRPRRLGVVISQCSQSLLNRVNLHLRLDPKSDPSRKDNLT